MHQPSSTVDRTSSRSGRLRVPPRLWRWWAVGAVLLLLAAPSAGASPLSSRPGQTLPPFTPTFTPTSLPTATPTFTPPPTDTPPPPTPTNTPALPPPRPTPTRPPLRPTATSTPVPTPTPTATPTPEPSPTPTPATVLELRLSARPEVVRQGERFQLTFYLLNRGPEEAVDVALRDRFPPDLVPGAVEPGGGVVTWEAEEGTAVLQVTWPVLPANSSTQVTVEVTVAEGVPDGAVIDNLAVVQAGNSEPVTAGISLGMPPFLLPTFR